MRILLLRIGAMGDVLHALPAVAALRSALPEAHLAWAVDPRWQPLLRDSLGRSPLLDTVHSVETRLWKRQPLSLATLHSLRSLRSTLRAAAFDLCIDLQGSVRSAVVGRFAHAPEFIGASHPREAPARFLYSRHVPLAEPHVVGQACELVSAAIARPVHPSPSVLPTDPPAEAWWAGHPLAGSPLAHEPFVLLVPQAGWGAKQWPAERFGILAGELASAGTRVLVNQVGTVDGLAAAVVQASRGAAVPLRTDLAQLIALTRRAALVVAGDTGPLHLAAALGRPVLALFGPTDPARTGPFGTPARVLRNPASVTDHSRHEATEGGLLLITTETVVEAAFDLLRQPPSRHRA